MGFTINEFDASGYQHAPSTNGDYKGKRPPNFEQRDRSNSGLGEYKTGLLPKEEDRIRFA